VLRVEPRAPMMDTALYGPVPTVDAVATYEADSEALAIFLVNRDQSQEAHLRIDLRTFAAPQVVEHLVVADDDPDACNTAEAPDRVRMQLASGSAQVDGGILTLTVPALSWSVVRAVAGVSDQGE
jgi:alpha-N-arabinofuranosidase